MTPFRKWISGRNKRIVAAVKSGALQWEVAQAYGVSRARVTQICQAAGIRKCTLSDEHRAHLSKIRSGENHWRKKHERY